MKTVLITGATSGIGRATARVLAKNNYKIVLCGRREDRILELQKELLEFTEVHSLLFDVRDKKAVFDSIASLPESFSTIDVLINNAGITRDTLLMRMSEQQWDEVINTNLKSAFNLTKAVQKPMLKARKGSIINMSSVVGVSGNAGQSNYAASKAGLIGFTKSIAQELGSRNIRCNAIAPGFIETEMTAALDEKVVQDWRNSIPLKRGGTPKDVADVTVFLASDMSSYVTGQTIHVCGGMLM